jgi:hypothetical protein
MLYVSIAVSRKRRQQHLSISAVDKKFSWILFSVSSNPSASSVYKVRL